MVVLASKVYVGGQARERATDSLESLVVEATKELDVSFDVGVRHDDFPTVTVDGPDAVVARNLLRETFGELVPTRSAGETYTGTLSEWTDDGFVLDVGFSETVTIPSETNDLGPGTPAQVRRRFGLVQHVPLQFVHGSPGSFAGETLDRLHDWRRTSGRVNVNSATRAEVRATVNRAGHANDIVTVERLGLLEQSIVCREGTDPPGLLASIGEYLPAELLCVV